MAITKVTNRVLEVDSVGTAQLSAGAVTEAKIANNAVTEAKIANNAVTSAKIADGTIVNNDISASAAIAGTKISPNFGTRDINTTGTAYADRFYANGVIYASDDKVRIGGGGLGGDQAGYIIFAVPGYGISRYWGGWSWPSVGQTRVGVATNGDIYVQGLATLGALAVAGYKAFCIDHPVRPGHQLVHIATESPTPDLIYRGIIKLNNGQVKVNIDDACKMTNGTVNALASNLVVTSLQNQTSFDRLKPSQVVNGEFTIFCENSSSQDEVAWVVIGTRRDIPLPEIEPLK